jgi:hypothetical protein
MMLRAKIEGPKWPDWPGKGRNGRIGRIEDLFVLNWILLFTTSVVILNLQKREFRIYHNLCVLRDVKKRIFSEVF